MQLSTLGGGLSYASTTQLCLGNAAMPGSSTIRSESACNEFQRTAYATGCLFSWLYSTSTGTCRKAAADSLENWHRLVSVFYWRAEFTSPWTTFGNELGWWIMVMDWCQTASCVPVWRYLRSIQHLAWGLWCFPLVRKWEIWSGDRAVVHSTRESGEVAEN